MSPILFKFDSLNSIYILSLKISVGGQILHLPEIKEYDHGNLVTSTYSSPIYTGIQLNNNIWK